MGEETADPILIDVSDGVDSMVALAMVDLHELARQAARKRGEVPDLWPVDGSGSSLRRVRRRRRKRVRPM